MSEKIRLTAETGNRLPDLEGGGERVRFCPKCGRRIPNDRQICAFCEGENAAPQRPKVSRLRKILLIAALLLGLLLLAVPVFLSGTRHSVPASTPTASAMPHGTSIPVYLLND